MNEEDGKSKKTEIDFGRLPFVFTPGESIGVLKFFGSLGPDLVKEFEKRLRTELSSFLGDLIFDFTETDSFHSTWVRPLMSTVTDIKKKQRRLRFVGTNPKLKIFFHEQGVAANFPLIPDLETAKLELGKKNPGKIDVVLINPFLDGMTLVLKKQAGITSTSGAPETRDPARSIDGDVSGVIGLSGENFSASVILSFPESTYLAIISRMLGEEHEAITPENQDGAAELVNMVFGHARRVLNENGRALKMALPSVVNGKDPASFAPISGPRIAIPFESDAGKFTIEIRIQST